MEKYTSQQNNFKIFLKLLQKFGKSLKKFTNKQKKFFLITKSLIFFYPKYLQKLKKNQKSIKKV